MRSFLAVVIDNLAYGKNLEQFVQKNFIEKSIKKLNKFIFFHNCFKNFNIFV
jgi:hypothetical protein